MSVREPPSEPNPPLVEVDAMDEQEWEHGQHTPEVGTDKLTALVKESATRTPPAGVPTTAARATAKTVKRGTTGEAAVVNQDDIVTAPAPTFEPAQLADATTTKPPPSGSSATPSGGRTRSGSTTLSPTAFIRRSGDTVDPPTSLGPKLAPRTSSSTKPPMIPLPRAAAAIALGNIPLDANANDLGVPALADDEDPSALAAYLSVPVGDERRARKRTLPPPSPRELGIEEKPEEVLTAWRGPAPTTAPSLWSPKNVALAGLTAALLIGALVIALGGRDATKPSAKTADASPTARGSDQVAVVPHEPSGSAQPESDEIEIETPPVTATKEPTPAAETATTTATAETTTSPPKVSTFRTQLAALLKNKEIVLEYDGRIGKNSAPASDQPAIAKARASHAAGTQRLLAGDFNGALDNYRRALAQYPAYVGSYRGMGLAYERMGDKSNALKALRMYVSVAPLATDVPVLRKRIDALLK